MDRVWVFQGLVSPLVNREQGWDDGTAWGTSPVGGRGGEWVEEEPRPVTGSPSAEIATQPPVSGEGC